MRPSCFALASAPPYALLFIIVDLFGCVLSNIAQMGVQREQRNMRAWLNTQSRLKRLTFDNTCFLGIVVGFLRYGMLKPC